MWIKICGMTTAAAVAAALDAQVDALGFVFAASARRLSIAQALRLAQPVRGRVRCIAVHRHPTQAAVDEIVSGFAPDVLQTDLADLPGLALPATLALLPVVRAGAPAPARVPARLLFEGPLSGSGVASDWQAARALARRTELVLAGGLNPLNVAAAITAVEPRGVDVSSGVEERLGVKSPAAIVAFISAARAAAPSSARSKELV